jgi:hypothetical protein
MPDAPKTQHRSIRIPDDDWTDLAERAGRVGLDRAKVVNQLVGWYLRRPGAKLPTRPPAPEEDDHA